MDFGTVLDEVRSWSAEARLRLVEEVWDGLLEEVPLPPLTDEVKALLDRRLEALDRNPDAVVSWDAVEARARERFRR